MRTMNPKTKIFAGVLVIAIALIIGWYVWSNQISPLTGGQATIKTDKTEYLYGEQIKLEIVNEVNSSLFLAPLSESEIETLYEAWEWGPVYTMLGTPCNCYSEFNCSEIQNVKPPYLIEIPANKTYSLIINSNCLISGEKKYRIRQRFLFGATPDDENACELNGKFILCTPEGYLKGTRFVYSNEFILKEK